MRVIPTAGLAVLLMSVSFNLHAQLIAEQDADFDNALDAADNCLHIANTAHVDADGDGYGNACDLDLNNDGIVNSVDLGLFRSVFFSNDPVADTNSDGAVNAIDLGVLRASFFQPPARPALRVGPT